MIHKPSLESLDVPQKIGSAVLTFIGYKQTDRQTDKPNLYIDSLLRSNRFYPYVIKFYRLTFIYQIDITYSLVN